MGYQLTTYEVGLNYGSRMTEPAPFYGIVSLMTLLGAMWSWSVDDKLPKLYFN